MLRIWCNDLEMVPETASAPSAVTSGRLIRRLGCGVDKLDAFERILKGEKKDEEASDDVTTAAAAPNAASEGTDCGGGGSGSATSVPRSGDGTAAATAQESLSVYIGDSVTDVLPLLQAHVGIIMQRGGSGAHARDGGPAAAPISSPSSSLHRLAAAVGIRILPLSALTQQALMSQLLLQPRQKQRRYPSYTLRWRGLAAETSSAIPSPSPSSSEAVEAPATTVASSSSSVSFPGDLTYGSSAGPLQNARPVSLTVRSPMVPVNNDDGVRVAAGASSSSAAAGGEDKSSSVSEGSPSRVCPVLFEAAGWDEVAAALRRIEGAAEAAAAAAAAAGSAY